MISAYAKRTSVPVKKTKAELDDLLEKFGAASRGIMSDDAAGNAAVVFILEGQKFRLDVPLPARSAFRRGDENRQEKAWEQACRERWRAVLLLVRAKLEIVRLGASTVEREFLSNLVLPSGRTVHDELGARLAEVLNGSPKPLLLGGGR